LAEHRGRGPCGYKRSDDRIREDVNDRLTDDPWIDASDIEVSVSSAEVTLDGTVNNRSDKRRAEDIAESVSGVCRTTCAFDSNRGRLWVQAMRLSAARVAQASQGRHLRPLQVLPARPARIRSAARAAAPDR
jgi:hypothetical protein